MFPLSSPTWRTPGVSWTCFRPPRRGLFLLPQPLLQLHPPLRPLVAVLDDDRGGERDSPFAAGALGDGAGAGDDDRSLGDDERLLPLGAVDGFADEVVDRGRAGEDRAGGEDR